MSGEHKIIFNNKPREWKLPLITLVVNSDMERDGVHVIEKSAYDELKKKLDEADHGAQALDLMLERDLYKSIAEKLEAALRPVIAISDRKHVAWDNAKEVLKEIETMKGKLG